jgi:hypothetical protein
MSLVLACYLVLLTLPALARTTALEPLPDLATAANNSLFDKWRPRAHFIAPSSWQNDLCTFNVIHRWQHCRSRVILGAPYYDAATEKYHMFYQVTFSCYTDERTAHAGGSTIRNTYSGATYPGGTRRAQTWLFGRTCPRRMSLGLLCFVLSDLCQQRRITRRWTDWVW